MVISIVNNLYETDTCNQIPPPNMPDTRNVKDCLELPPTTFSIFTLKNVTWTYLINFTVQFRFLFRFVYIELVSLILFLQIWVAMYGYVGLCRAVQGYVWLYRAMYVYAFSCNSLSDSIVNRYIGIMKNKYVSYWNQTLQQSQKLSFYCTIKDDCSLE